MSPADVIASLAALVARSGEEGVRISSSEVVALEGFALAGQKLPDGSYVLRVCRDADALRVREELRALSPCSCPRCTAHRAEAN